MGSTVILVGAVALGASLVSLICGYFWGRSNVRSQIEDALDKARISADAREFSVREELDEKMVELADLRARTEEIPRLRDQIERLQSERTRNPVAGRPGAYAQENNNSFAEQKAPAKVEAPVPVAESADKTIQNLLKSIEERMKQPEEAPRVTVQAPAPPPVIQAPPLATRFAVEIPPAVTQLSGKPAAVEVPRQKPAPPVKDEWQEFAASLAALKNRQKQ